MQIEKRKKHKAVLWLTGSRRRRNVCVLCVCVSHLNHFAQITPKLYCTLDFCTICESQNEFHLIIYLQQGLIDTYHTTNDTNFGSVYITREYTQTHTQKGEKVCTWIQFYLSDAVSFCLVTPFKYLLFFRFNVKIKFGAFTYAFRWNSLRSLSIFKIRCPFRFLYSAGAQRLSNFKKNAHPYHFFQLINDRIKDCSMFIFM